jgi:hypothetical protein
VSIREGEDVGGAEGYNLVNIKVTSVMLTEEYIVMLLIKIDLELLSLYVLSIGFVQRKIRNLSIIFYTCQRRNTQMKNIAMRSFVVVLALVGFGATTVTSSAKTTSSLVATSIRQAHVNGVTSPTPLCAPGSTCGLD